MRSSLLATQTGQICTCRCRLHQPASRPIQQLLWPGAFLNYAAQHSSAGSTLRKRPRAPALSAAAASLWDAASSPAQPARYPAAPAPLPASYTAASLLNAAGVALGDAALLLAASLVISPAPAALAAAEGNSVAYDNATGSEGLRTAFGVGYVVLVAIFAVRLLTKRAQRSKTERLAGKKEDGVGEQQASAPQPQPSATAEDRTTAWGALYGAAQAAFLFTVLWTLTTNLSGYFDTKPLPANYTARNITVAVKTAVEGLAYLLTFIFGANSLGLAALAVQLALFPHAGLQPGDIPKVVDRNALPKIKLTDNIYDIRRAFEEVQQQASKSSGSSAEKK